MAGHIARMGTHIRDAVQLCVALTLPSERAEKSAMELVVLGMGGFAIGGDLARSYSIFVVECPFCR